MDQRLIGAIANPAIRKDASELVRLALFALEDLRKLDDTLYGRFVASRTSGQDAKQATAGLRLVWSDTFHALEYLLAFCRELTASQKPAEPTNADQDNLDFDAFGPSLPVEEPKLDLELGDIGELVAGFDEGTQKDPEGTRWNEALGKIHGIQYALEQQYRDAGERLAVSVGAGHVGGVLGLLDDMASSANEGIHALVACVYEAFVPETDRAAIVPEYLTTLTRALLVRRGISQLAAALAPFNKVLQGPHESEHEAALASFRLGVSAFVASETWRAMRAADRWELAQFDQQLREQPLKQARFTAEGLAKYLESLDAINHREVLVRHDLRVLDELRDSVTSARELMTLSPKTSHELLMKACKTAGELRGRNPALDRLLDLSAGITAETSSPSQNEAIAKRLEEMLAAAG